MMVQFHKEHKMETTHKNQESIVIAFQDTHTHVVRAAGAAGSRNEIRETICLNRELDLAGADNGTDADMKNSAN